ncbi:MAG TPA: single-stranded DNA-binding protein [Anaerolineales bacterium]|nr:single-stranded DNA-binding protein [Anaerolineales bacterium]
MPALNRVQLIGYLGRDPESKYTPRGRRVTDFSLGITQRWKGEEGEAREHTEWVNIEAWGRLAEVCHEYLTKGSLVYIEGRLKTNRYEDQAGEPRFFTKVVAQTVQFLDTRSENAFVEHADPAEEEEDQAEPQANAS